MENLSVISRNPSVIYIGAENIDEDRIDGEFYNYKYLENEIKLKKSGIKIKVLNDVIERMNSPIGWQGIPSSSYLPHGLGVPLIRVQNVSDLILDEESLIGVEESIYDEQPAIQAQPNDIIITRVGTIGRVCRIPEKINRIAMGQNLTRIKLNETLVESGFMLAYMSSKFCQIQMERYAYGGVQASLTNKNIKQLLVPIPSPEIQKYIGDKVRKAEGLREEAKRLKKEAEEIFNQNYEQIRKNNSKFEWVNSYYLNEDNIIPNFYKQYELLKDKKHAYIEFENIIESIKCGIPVRSDMRIGDIYPFYGASGVTDNIGDYNFDGEYLIVAQDGSIGLVNVARNKFWANNHVWVVQVKEGWDLEFLELYLNKYNYWISLTTGSVVPKVTSENLKRLLVPKIDYEIQRSIGDKIREAKYKDENSKMLIEQAKNDVEDLIEGNFDMSKVKANN